MVTKLRSGQEMLYTYQSKVNILKMKQCRVTVFV